MPRLTTSKRIDWTLACLALPLVMAVMVAGCKPQSAEVESVQQPAELPPPDPLTIMVVGDNALGPKVARQWAARRDGELEVIDQSLESWIESGLAIAPEVDLVVYPPMFVGQLAEEKKIVPLSRSRWNSDEINKDEYLNQYQRTIIRYGNKPYGLPLGCPHFSMLYRRDRFEDQQSSWPRSWEQLEARLASLNAGSENGDSPVKLDVPLARHWAAWSLLARVAPNVRVRGNFSSVFDRRTMEPLIATPPFVEALEQFKRIASERSIKLTPRDAYRLAKSGDAVVAMTWPARGFDILDQNEASDGEAQVDAPMEQLAVAPLPESRRLYQFGKQEWKDRLESDQNSIDLVGFSGLMVSLTSTTEFEYSAWELLSWLAEKKVTMLVAPESPLTGMHRASHAADPTRWTGDRVSFDLAERYAELMMDAHEQPITMVFPRIPASHEYVDALDQGIRNYLQNDVTAQETLDEVAERWRGITKRLGIMEQYNAIRREAGF